MTGSFGGALYHEMGLGKSAVACGLIVNFGFDRTLIVAPKSVITTHVWDKEFARFPDKVKVVQLSHRNAGSAKALRVLRDELEQQSIDHVRRAFMITYQLVWRANVANALLAADFRCCVVDESQRIKSPGGKCALFMGQFGKHVPYRLALTGTPLPHSPTDVYAQYRFLDPGIFGTSFARFRDRYCDMGGYEGHQVIGYRDLDDLHARMYRIAHRVTADVLHLPEPVDIERKFELSAQAERYYTAIAERGIISISENERVTASNCLVEMLREAQITSGFLPVSSSGELDAEARAAFIAAGLDIPPVTAGRIIDIDTGKVDLLAEVLEDLPNDYTQSPPKMEPCVIFARFHHDLDNVKKVCASLGRTCAELSGRLDQTEAWQQGEYDDIVVQLQSGGVGIDLTRAHYCVYYSLDFNLGNYLQSRKRLDRPGQTQVVRYIHLVAENTVDEYVLEALASRQEVATYVVDVLQHDRPRFEFGMA